MNMLTVAIQAGGESRRMGQDKALLPFLGQPLIARVAARMASIADEVIVTTNRPDAYAFLGLPLFADQRAGRGALGGLYTALQAARQPLVAVVACDMPFASPELLAFQARVLEAEAVDVVIPFVQGVDGGSGGYEPLHAVYRRETCLPAVEQALDSDQWKVIAWFSKVRVRALTEEECRVHDPGGLAFANVNTPQELSEAEQMARGEG
ncbi:MAG: molybdenum cofactor guanylyltransferase [Chloroflexi bacterium]|nr:molybdenum cofactor guanylyltransferase [Chloroflexota bacterium]